jgi:4-alpha-glucanotransferase
VADTRSGRFHHGRHAGAIVPLFSIPSRSSWGIGEIADIPRLAAWLASAGLGFVQLLPINEMERGQSSPYSALTAMAIDPLYVAMSQVEDFAAAGGEAALAAEAQEGIDEARRAPRVQYAAIGALKAAALRAAFAAFDARASAGAAARDEQFAAFVEREQWWLDDYALFRALHDEHDGCYWRDWSNSLRDRARPALDAARARLASSVRYYQYVQWVADSQWQQARAACGAVGIFGDFPFMVNGHSADVWARQREFHLDASVGVPVAEGAEEAQDWGLPAYRWDIIAAEGYGWLAERTRRSADLFDAFRVDHLVGFYRTYARDRSGHGFFSPGDEPAQLAQGEALMALFRSRGSLIVAEDLGVVPDFVRASQARMGVPGLKVLRWERLWHSHGQPFRDPREYPACSVAISGTHDTETMNEWWEGAGGQERRAAAAIPALRDAGIDADTAYTPATRDALVQALFESGSDLVMLPLQDFFGWRDRINTPSKVGDENWTWRLPYTVESLMTDPAAVERASWIRGLSEQTRRLPAVER